MLNAAFTFKATSILFTFILFCSVMVIGISQPPQTKSLFAFTHTRLIMTDKKITLFKMITTDHKAFACYSNECTKSNAALSDTCVHARIVTFMGYNPCRGLLHKVHNARDTVVPHHVHQSFIRSRGTAANGPEKNKTSREKRSKMMPKR